MGELFRHFTRRGAQDRLDVVALLLAGLNGDKTRIPLVFDGQNVALDKLAGLIQRAQRQLHRQGLRPGQRVAVMLGNSLEHVALIYALILSGLVWVPINVRLRAGGLEHVLGHSKPQLLIFDQEFEPVIDQLHRETSISLDALLQPIDQSAEALWAAKPAPEDPVCIIYTSGTTGAAKGVTFTHRMLRIASEAALIVADLQKGDRAFLWEPLCHIGGAQMLMAPFLVDIQLHVVPRFSASMFWQQWTSAGATHLHYLGGVLDVLMQRKDPPGLPIPAILTAWGAGISARAWVGIEERFGCRLRECYGMTECSSFATLNTSGTPGSIGRPLPWIQLELRDELGRPVATGEIGEIVLSSDLEGAFFPGYLDNTDATQQTLRDGKLYTGDLARQLGSGEFVFVGRRTDSMRVRGENVSAWEVERVFLEHPSIEAVAAIGIASEVGEQDILFYVQPKANRSVDWAELIAWAQPRLASFQLPRYFKIIDRFDLTPSERIRKHLLPRTIDGAWDRAHVSAKKEVING
ncbi:AMP-binding protein [Bosea sp. NPDC055332]